MIDTQNKSGKRGSGSSGIGNSSEHKLSLEQHEAEDKDFYRENTDKYNSDTESVGSTEQRRGDIFEEDMSFSANRHISVIADRDEDTFANNQNTSDTEDKIPVRENHNQSHWRSSATSISVKVSESDLEGQKQNLMEEGDLSETVAESIFDLFQTMVEEEAKKQNKNWSTEVIQDVTNAMIAIAIQEEKQRSLLF